MLTQWIANIVGVAALGTLMDMVIPKGNLKTYTRFFIGLITLLIILQPILKLLGQLPNLEKKLWSDMIAAELQVSYTPSQAIEINQKEYLMELYKKRVEEDVVRRVEKYVPNSIVSSIVTVDELEQEGMINIKRIDVFIGYSKDESLGIKPVEISIGSKSKDQESKPFQTRENENYDELKKHLSDTYEIEESRIYINNG